MGGEVRKASASRCLQATVATAPVASSLACVIISPALVNPTKPLTQRLLSSFEGMKVADRVRLEALLNSYAHWEDFATYLIHHYMKDDG